jgi:cytochrome P450
VRYARKLPLSVICELLGLPETDRPMFSAWADGATRFTGVVGFLGMVPKMFAMKRYMEKQIDHARAHGGDGLIAELVRVEREGGRISRDEMVSMLFLLLFAGHETTTHLITGSAYELLRDRELLDWLKADWDRVDLAVEEFLRFISPVQFTKPRYVRRNVELGGVTLNKGARVMPMLAAANMDPHSNSDPDKLNLARRPNRHVAFGTGIHFCLGHQLARIEGQCALKALFKRWPALELAVDESRIRWRKRPGMKAIEELPIAASQIGGINSVSAVRSEG